MRMRSMIFVSDERAIGMSNANKSKAVGVYCALLSSHSMPLRNARSLSDDFPTLSFYAVSLLLNASLETII